MQSPTTLMRLNFETRQHHDKADAVWFDVATQLTVDRYIDQLGRTYGLETVVEALFAYTPRLPDLINLRLRARSRRIVEDLLSLGFSASQVANLDQCTTVMPFSDPIEALGWMYVLERATLGYELIRAQVVKNPRLVQATAYLGAYGDAAHEMWQELGVSLDRAVTTPDELRRVVGAANAAFAQTRAWYDERPRRSRRPTPGPRVQRP
jgi:heme oxygenase